TALPATARTIRRVVRVLFRLPRRDVRGLGAIPGHVHGADPADVGAWLRGAGIRYERPQWRDVRIPGRVDQQSGVQRNGVEYFRPMRGLRPGIAVAGRTSAMPPVSDAESRLDAMDD